MAKLATKPVDGEWSMRAGEDFTAYLERTDEMFRTLVESADKHGVIGALLSFPVADGCAMYRVSKESPLTLEHVPYGDAWQISPAHIRGINKADVLEQIRRTRALGKMFG